jgi:RHS repeat-associated protein
VRNLPYLLTLLIFVGVTSVHPTTAWTQVLGPECIQNGGTAECVPFERLGPMVYGGDGDDNYIDALLHDPQTDAPLSFKSADEVKAKVDAGYNKPYAACRSWTQVENWKSLIEKFPCENGVFYGWCSVSGNSYLIVADEEIKRLTYASTCAAVPTKVHLTTARSQQAFCPEGFKAHEGGKLQNTYCVRANPNPLNLAKNNGCSNLVGNPCNAATGNKYQREVDYVAPNVGGLEFVRIYNSSTGAWTHSYSNRITVKFYNPAVFGSVVTVHRPDGREFNFFKGPDNRFVPDPDVHSDVVPQYVDSKQSGWIFTTEDGTAESYDSNGRLTKITLLSGLATTISYGTGAVVVRDAFGRTIEIHKNAAGQLTQVIDPAKRTFVYKYDTAGNLSSVLYPDLVTRVYHYNEAAFTGGRAFPRALTGITDENGKRFATFTYDAKQRVIVSEHPLGADRVAIKYLADPAQDGYAESEVTDALGTTRVYTFGISAGVLRNFGISAPCASCGDDAKEKFYDFENGNLLRRTDHNGILTTYAYNERGLEEGRTVTPDTPEARTTTTIWHDKFRKPIEIGEGNRIFEFVYDSVSGALISRVIKDKVENTSQKWAYKYNGYGQVTEIDGPRTDVNDIDTFQYGTSGNLQTATNALGHVVQYLAYDVEGRPTVIKDSNGVETKISYDARGRLSWRTIGQETVKFGYDKLGHLQTLTLPSTEVITYKYDDAHRLTDITNSLGERIHYTLDAAGNRTKKEIFNRAGSVSLVAEASFDQFDRLHKVFQSNGTATTFEYDPNGNLTNVTNPSDHRTTFILDEFNRTRQVTSQDQSSVKIDYDSNDQINSVTNAKDIAVTYAKNALGQTTSIETDDPDAYTRTAEFDSAGNVISKIDYRGITTTYSYDALNRIKTFSAAGATTVVYGYDAGINGKGRLTSIDDESGTTTRTYNSQGRVDTVRRMFSGLTITTRYLYDTAGRLTQLIYPSGREVTYRYEKDRIVGMDIGGTVVLSNIAYEPFSEVRSWRWGNGKDYVRTRDLDGRVASYSHGDTQQSIKRDDQGNILSITDGSNVLQSQKFKYDELNRLTDYFVGLSSEAQEHYDYDMNGNRTAITIAGKLYPYVYDEYSDFLLSVPGPEPRDWSFDSALSLQDGVRTFGIDSFRRVSSVTNGARSVTYKRNGVHQRVTKSSNDGYVSHYIYDEQGKLLAELDKSGVAVAEHIWLHDQPVAVLNRGVVNYVFADHLNTPRVVTDTANRVRWSWLSDPFGRALPKDNPAGLGTFTYNLRFPGQYYDVESGLHYNYFRDYDPQTGRYVQSDPIGLAGGFNTYAYVDNDPIQATDRLGLEKDIYFHPYFDNALWKGATADPDRPGILTVYAHGVADKINDFDIFKKYGRGLDADELAERIRKGSTWKPGMPVWLKACSTGSTADGMGQDLADNLGVDVYAPNKYVWYTENGPVGPAGKIGPPGKETRDTNDPGAYIRFRPRRQ